MNLRRATNELHERLDRTIERAGLLRRSHDQLYAALKALVEAKDDDAWRTALFNAFFALGYADGLDDK